MPVLLANWVTGSVISCEQAGWLFSASSNLAFCSEMYLWGRSNSTSCLLITELCQGCKDYQFQKKLNEAVEER